MEMKFRAWDIEEKRYRDDGQLQMYNDGEWTYYVENHCQCGYSCNAEWLCKNRIILEWYTGFKDKKRTEEFPEGQEIYEGDVVEQDREDSFPKYNTGEIVYDDHRGRYLIRYFKKITKNSFLRKLGKNGDVITDVSGDYLYGKLVYWPMEVIGTIHQDTEK